MVVRMSVKLCHLLVFGLYVSTIAYDLVVPLTEEEALLGGRLKFLTFIDSVKAFRFKMAPFLFVRIMLSADLKNKIVIKKFTNC